MRYKDFLSSIPGVIAGLVGSSFVLIAILEWAYHYSIGSSFIYLNSPTDLASLSLLYLPIVGISSFLMAVFCLFIHRLQLRMLWQIVAWLVLYATGVILNFITLPTLEHHNALSTILLSAASFFVLWPIFVGWLLRGSIFLNGLTEKGRLMLNGVLTLVPLLMGLFFMIGAYKASTDLSFTRGNYQVVYLNDVVEDNIRLLKSTSKGILILRLPGKEISFLNYHSFKRIDWTGASVQE